MESLAVVVLGIVGLVFFLSRKLRSAPSAEKIISDYGAFVERDNPTPLRIEDVAALPYPKDTILSALLSAVVPGNDKKNDWLASGAIFLAQFQPGVGNEPLYQGGFDLTAHLRQPVDGSDLAAAKVEFEAMVAKTEKFKEQAERFEMFSVLVERDLDLMMARFRTAAKQP